MNAYRFHAWPTFRFPTYSLTSESLVGTLAGVVVRQFASAPTGYDVNVQLDRPSHHDAVADIHAALTQLGFNTAQVVITEWATSMVEGALVGTAGGGALGSAAKDPWAIVFGAAVGFLVGAAVGSGINSVKAMYQADRLFPHRYGWQFTELPMPSIDAGPGTWSPA